MATARECLAWILFWMGDSAARAVVLADNWFCDWLAKRFAGTYCRLMAWSVFVQGSGEGPWLPEDLDNELQG